MTFKNWEHEVDKLMEEKHGVGIDDIPDMAWHDWYSNGISVKRAVKMAIDIVNEGGF